MELTTGEFLLADFSRIHAINQQINHYSTWEIYTEVKKKNNSQQKNRTNNIIE